MTTQVAGLNLANQYRAIRKRRETRRILMLILT